MRDPNRIDKTLELIGKIWKKYPDLRLGQLIGNAINNMQILYYIEEPDLITALSNLYKVDLTENNKERAGKETGLQNKNRIYMHNDTEVKAVKAEDVEKYKSLGYKIGRK